MVLDDFSIQKKPSGPPHSEGQPGAPHFEARLASPIDRLAANVADFVIFFPLLALVTSVFSRYAKEAQLVGNDSEWSMAVAGAVGSGFLSLVLYQAVAVICWGATPGKLALHLRVVSLWGREKPKPMDAFLRGLIWSLELLLFGIPFLAVFSNERRRPFHDRIADTVVVALNRHRQSGMARFAELSLASGFQSAALALVALFAALHIADFKKHSSTLSAAIQKEEAQGRLCAEIREELEESPGKDVNSFSDRLNAAITLFASDDLDIDCLDSEADFALWKNQERPLAYLAKGLSTSDEEREESYFEKACPSSQGEVDSDANHGHQRDVCKMISLTTTIDALAQPDAEAASAREARDNQIQGEAAFDGVVNSLNEKSAVYLRILAVRHLMAIGEFARALDLTGLTSDSRRANVFMAKQRAMALFGVGRKKEARASMRSAVALVDSKARVEMSRWFCSSEIYADGCSAESADACGILDSAVTKSAHWLLHPDVAAAYIHSKACRGDTGADSWRALEEKMPLTEGKTYLEALALLSENKSPAAVAKLKTLVDPVLNEHGAFFLEANARLVEIARSAADVVPIKNSWDKLDASEEVYRPLGQSLLRRLNALKAWDQALAVGLKLSKYNRYDREIFEQLVIAAHGIGNQKLALGFLDKILSLRPHAEESRGPASVDSFESIAEELLAKREVLEQTPGSAAPAVKSATEAK